MPSRKGITLLLLVVSTNPLTFDIGAVFLPLYIGANIIECLGADKTVGAVGGWLQVCIFAAGL